MVKTYWRSDAIESHCRVSTASPLAREKQQHFQHAADLGEGALAAETWLAMSDGAESHVPSSGGPPRYLSQNDSSLFLSLSESLTQSISGLCF